MQMPVLAMGWLQSQFGSAPCVPTQPNRRRMVPWAVMIMVPSWGVVAAASRTTASECFYAGLSCGHAAAHASGHPGAGGVDVAAYAVVVVAHF